MTGKQATFFPHFIQSQLHRTGEKFGLSGTSGGLQHSALIKAGLGSRSSPVVRGLAPLSFDSL